MKELLKKPWFIVTSIFGLIAIILLSNLAIMSLRLTSPYQDDSLWTLGRDLSNGLNVNIFAFIIMILFYSAIVPILLAVFSFFKKNNWGFIVTAVYFIVFDTAVIVFQSSFNYLTIFAIILIILNIIFTASIFVLLILRKKAFNLTKDLEKSDREIKLIQSKIPVYILIIDIVSIVFFLTTFFIPLYSLDETQGIYNAIIIQVLLSGDTNIETVAYFFANFAIFLGIFLYLSNCLSSYFFDKESFINKSKTLITAGFVATVAFFVTGLVITMVYALNGYFASTYAFIPMLLMSFTVFAYAIYKGQFNTFVQIADKEVKIKYPKIEPLIYVITLTAITVLMLLLPIIKIDVTGGVIPYNVNLTGLDILRDYMFLEEGYRMVAFILVVMLLSVGLFLIVTLTTYLSKYRQFDTIVKSATFTNVFFVFIVAISGYYFQIAKEINIGVLTEMLAFYGFSVPSSIDFDYTVSTDAIYALLVSVFVLVLMITRKAFDRDQLGIIDGNLLPLNGAPDNTSTTSSNGTSLDESNHQFDPCPAFTELDSKIQLFKQDLEKRKGYKVSETSLNQLIYFVVEYARNSRLHLSYTPEDIATFVAGLGASKLSILQGMSGTGKTSLPKIFSEAVFGNCEIIEVESSWKDKNELLGYYNEFSMKYTPKKFTLALYKAALNQDIFTFILLDEMNLSRIEYYFSDFLSLMENEEGQREIKLINIKLNRKEEDQEIDYLALEGGHTLKVSSNVWFIGTANRDESTFVISDKVYDRAHTMNFVKRAAKVRNYTNPNPKQFYDYKTVNQLFVDAKQNGDFDAENNVLIKSVEAILAPYNISFGNRILKQIEDFVNIYKACFPNLAVEKDAIEKILLSKVVAKLEVKTIDDKEKLEMEFEKLDLKQCAAFIKRLDNE